MLYIAERDKCCGCSACASVCPTQCIEMIEDEEGFLFPRIKEECCIECGNCKTVCPAINRQKVIKGKPDMYAAICCEDAVREQSSSGGVFSMLAQQVLNVGGVVFGAAFSADCHRIKHIAIQQMEELEMLRGSKYVESAIGNTYEQAKCFLDGGREVLFSGTPCQIEGLRLYLHKDYDNLLCVDLICHGVPSVKVWDKYLKFREHKAGSPVKKVSFRNKVNGWERFSLSLDFANGVQYIAPHSKDVYMKAFLKNICLRSSCGQCCVKGINRVSDLTLADFWGIKNVVPGLYDDKGTSLIIVHTENGKRALGQIKAKMRYQKVEDVSAALKCNQSAVKDVVPHANRRAFFARLENTDFDELVLETIIKNTPEYRWVCTNIEILKMNKVYIYGAGKIAGRLIEVLEMKDIYVEGVLVTDLLSNPKTFLGYTVVTLDDAKINVDHDIVIPAVAECYQDEILSFLLTKKVKKILCYKSSKM